MGELRTSVSCCVILFAIIELFLGVIIPDPGAITFALVFFNTLRLSFYILMLSKTGVAFLKRVIIQNNMQLFIKY
ncbi:hypothetical protein Ocin01_17247 [Orchesella cincta]|uniref:Uncharacterized protein n=1 Tax=Orchesella cincta TaxID=48709 RepID=A0A1D2M8Y2_ORCCI|nr:hypothetical protein Ocin01_17247 [Orchesella cincta]